MAQILKKASSFLEKYKHKKNVDSGSTFKTFVNSLPQVKNNTNIQNVFKYEYLETKYGLILFRCAGV